MLKNENGCPCMNTARASAQVTAENNVKATSCTEAGMCGGTGDCRDNMPLGYVYAPDQKFCMLYSAKDALAHGTLFEELYKPMEVYGRE